MVYQHLMHVSAGEVKTLVCDDMVAALSQLELSATTLDVQHTIATRVWDALPEQTIVLHNLHQTLAQAALATWPFWYEPGFEFDAAAAVGSDRAVMNQFKCEELQAQQQDICLPWLKSAVRACELDKVPLLKEFPRSLQVAQLARAIGKDSLMVVLVINDTQPESHTLFGLAKSAAWLAKEANVPVAVLIPDRLAQYQELESILYGAVTLAQLVEPIEPEAIEETKQLLQPLVGRPHPFSPGEQRLAEYLVLDDELAGLFQFNQRIQTVRQTQGCFILNFDFLCIYENALF